MLRPTLLLALAACGPAHPAELLRAAALTAPDLQALIDASAGGIALIPPGRHVVGPGPESWCLRVPAGTTLRGAPGAVLVQAPMPGGRRLIGVLDPDVVIEDLELDGQRALQPDQDEHRAGVMALGAERLVIRRVVAHDFSGDGFVVHAAGQPSRDVTFERVVARGNTRNGLTFSGDTRRALISDSTFSGNGAQQLDSEAPSGTVDDVTMRRSLLDGAGASGDYVLTISGSAPDRLSRRWLIEGGTINGGVLVVWSDGVTIRGNRGVNPTAHPVRIYRTSRDVVIDDNDLASTQTTTPELGVISVLGTEGGAPRGTRIIRNTLRAAGLGAAVGIYAAGAGDLEISDNALIGPGLPSGLGAGVVLRATSAGCAFDAAIIRRNRISDWGAVGVAVIGNGPAALGLVDVRDNVFDSMTGSMDAALSLDRDGSGAARAVQVSGNVLLGLARTLIQTAPAGDRTPLGAGDRWDRK